MAIDRAGGQRRLLAEQGAILLPHQLEQHAELEQARRVAVVRSQGVQAFADHRRQRNALEGGPDERGGVARHSGPQPWLDPEGRRHLGPDWGGAEPPSDAEHRIRQQIDVLGAGPMIEDGGADREPAVDDGGRWRRHAGLLKLDDDR